LDNLSLRLKLKGSFAVALTRLELDGDNCTKYILCGEKVSSGEVGEFDFKYPNAPANGMMSFEITALEEHSEFHGGAYFTELDEKTLPDVNIAICMCTYHREDYIKNNIDMLNKNVFSSENSTIKDNLYVYIADNGKTLQADKLASEKIKIFPNVNGGGAAGFSRTLIEAYADKDAHNITHCILMDDDVVFTHYARLNEHTARIFPAFIIKRLPFRFVYDNNYFNDRYQGIPIGGYTKLIEKMLNDCEVKLNTDYFTFITENPDIAKKTIYTGAIDEFFDYTLGELEYRSLRFETEELSVANYQGNAVVNYTEREVPYTRIIEHKHFEYGKQDTTVITREYPATWEKGLEPYYPINNDRNDKLYLAYKSLADTQKDVIFGGRLGQYKYYDMDKVIEAALLAVKQEE
jgi:UDP-galactopyranose mutase